MWTLCDKVLNFLLIIGFVKMSNFMSLYQGSIHIFDLADHIFDQYGGILINVMPSLSQYFSKMVLMYCLPFSVPRFFFITLIMDSDDMNFKNFNSIYLEKQSINTRTYFPLGSHWLWNSMDCLEKLFFALKLDGVVVKQACNLCMSLRNFQHLDRYEATTPRLSIDALQLTHQDVLHGPILKLFFAVLWG